jgi:heptosyltransferase-1
LPSSDLRSRRFERILLIKPSAVGDVIHTIPVLVKLRARYPAARIDWLITPENADLVRHHPALSNVVAFPRRGFGKRWSATVGAVRLLAEIRKPRYDLVVDMHGQLRSAIFGLVSGAGVRIGFPRPLARSRQDAFRHGWVGAKEGSWITYTHHLPIHSLEAHAVDRYLWLGELLGFDDRPPDFRVYLPADTDARLDRLLEEHRRAGRPLAVLVPGTIWATKHWHVAGFAGVGRHLIAAGFAVVLAGTAKDHDRCRAIVGLCPGARDLSGQTTVGDLIALVRRAAICVTNDSGSMHLAVALERPVVSVFGPTDPVRIGPYGRPNAVVRVDLPCSPCYLRHLWTCRHDHACMKQVTAEMVLERVWQVLGRDRVSD